MPSLSLDQPFGQFFWCFAQNCIWIREITLWIMDSVCENTKGWNY